MAALLFKIVIVIAWAVAPDIFIAIAGHIQQHRSYLYVNAHQ